MEKSSGTLWHCYTEEILQTLFLIILTTLPLIKGSEVLARRFRV